MWFLYRSGTSNLLDQSSLSFPTQYKSDREDDHELLSLQRRSIDPLVPETGDVGNNIV